ncbi:hypothetical protein ACOSQ2_008726 [Xanthoceras sorbifolium]
MAGISPKIIFMKLMVVCIAMLVSTGLAQLPLPLQPVPELQKCWAAITSAPGCIMEIYGSLLSGQIVSVGPVCCAAITQVSENCWPMMFPANPFFPPLLKNFCAASSPKAAGGNAASRMALPGLLPPVMQPNMQNAEINKSVSSGEISGIGPACCKAVTEIKDKCWPKIFPFNPFFPPLLKSTCAKLIGAPATAPAITS